MRNQALFWAGVSLYFFAVGLLYVIVGGEAVGISLLLLAGALGGLIAGWAWAWQHRHPVIGPEDRPDADASDETGVVGVYPSASLRPLALAAGISAMALGVPLGSWMSIAGLAVVMSQVLLLVRDADPPEESA